MEFDELNIWIKEFLKYNGYNSSLQAFENEEKSRLALTKHKKPLNIIPKDINDKSIPTLYKLFESEKSKKENKSEKDLKELQKKHNAVLQSARQIFSIAINCLQQLHNIKDGNSIGENLAETIENYKIQLGKYHKILLSEGADKSELFSESVMLDHKSKLIKAKEESSLENIIEVLLSLRVNALQISPELRKNLVYELIRNDIFLISAKKSNYFVLDLLNISSNSLRHALCALISVIVSTYKGVEYITENDNSILQKIIDILQDEEDGSVTQRFALAILQKMSIKEDTVETIMKFKMIDWVVKLVERSLEKEVHIFSLDFATALLANILHASNTQEYLLKNLSFARSIMERLLGMIKEQIPTSVLMHVLICLSYLSREKFSKTVEECKFVDKISDFVESYSKSNGTGKGQTNENDEIDRRTVLDLCAHMFHPKDKANEYSQTLEYNDMKCDDKIREFENEQGDLIFECFPDEVS